MKVTFKSQSQLIAENIKDHPESIYILPAQFLDGMTVDIMDWNGQMGYFKLPWRKSTYRMTKLMIEKYCIDKNDKNSKNQKYRVAVFTSGRNIGQKGLISNYCDEFNSNGWVSIQMAEDQAIFDSYSMKNIHIYKNQVSGWNEFNQIFNNT